jgi:hypothetical protein
MREQHPVFDAAISRDEPVWRYFDLPKFLSFLQRRALFFSRADLLGDPLEGSFTKATAAQRADSERCRSTFRGDGDHDSELMPITIPR